MAATAGLWASNWLDLVSWRPGRRRENWALKRRYLKGDSWLPDRSLASTPSKMSLEVTFSPAPEIVRLEMDTRLYLTTTEHITMPRRLHFGRLWTPFGRHQVGPDDDAQNRFVRRLQPTLRCSSCTVAARNFLLTCLHAELTIIWTASCMRCRSSPSVAN